MRRGLSLRPADYKVNNMHSRKLTGCWPGGGMVAAMRSMGAGGAELVRPAAPSVSGCMSCCTHSAGPPSSLVYSGTCRSKPCAHC